MDDSLLLQFIQEGRVEDTELLLTTKKCSANTRKQLPYRTPALVLCVLFSSEKSNSCFEEDESIRCALLRVLVQHGAHLDSTDKHGMTAAMYAAERGYLRCLNFLVNAGVNLTLVDADGRSFLMLAAMHGHSQCLSFLISNVTQSTLDWTDKIGRTALMVAAINLEMTCLQQLLHAGADVNIQDHKGYTVLLHMLRYVGNSCNNMLRRSCSDVMRDLLNHGANMNVVSLNGETPLTIVMREVPRNQSLLLKLLDLGADMSLSLLDQRYLHQMVVQGEHLIIRRMIMNGCPPLNIQCKAFLFPFSHPVSSLSPLAVALLSHRPVFACYFLQNRFLTNFDLADLARDPTICQALRQTTDNEEDETKRQKCLSILHFLSLTPPKLFTLSFVAVSSAIENVRPLSTESKSYELPSRKHPKSFGARLFRKSNGLGLTSEKSPRTSSCAKMSQESTSLNKQKSLSRRQKIACLDLPRTLKHALSFQKQSIEVLPEFWPLHPIW